MWPDMGDQTRISVTLHKFETHIVFNGYVRSEPSSVFTTLSMMAYMRTDLTTPTVCQLAKELSLCVLVLLTKYLSL